MKKNITNNEVLLEAVRELSRVWLQQSGRMWELAGESNPRLQAIEAAIDNVVKVAAESAAPGNLEAELRNELERLRDIVCPEDAESIDAVLARKTDGAK